MVAHLAAMDGPSAPSHGAYSRVNQSFDNVVVETPVEKIMETLVGTPATNPQSIIDRLVAAERVHRSTAEQHDDLTMLVGGLA